jgi:hypothetical protein
VIALMMEAARTSETLVNFYQTTRRFNPEEAIFVLTAVRISNPTKKKSDFGRSPTEARRLQFDQEKSRVHGESS